METAMFFGLLSCLILTSSAIPYGIRTYQRLIVPNLTTWTLWTIIGVSLLVTYSGSGAKINVLPAISGAMNPLIILVLLVVRRERFAKLGAFDLICLVLSLVSIGLWYVFRNERGLAQYALYASIAADGLAASPTALSVWTRPQDERPLAWILAGLGYLVAFFSITEHTYANYALPAYMVLMDIAIIFPLVKYRIDKKIALREWC
jgi:hypothetical protein